MGKLSTQYVELGDVRLAYREYGDGPALLLLHGNSGSKALFRKYQLEHFRGYRTLAVDSRGHGQSVSNDNEYSIKQYADDMVRLCTAKGIRGACVVGYSDGGNIALWLAQMAPDLFRKVLAISPNYLVSGSTDESLKQIQGAVKVLEFLGKCGFHTKKPIMRMMLMLKDIGISAAELGGIRTSLMILYAQDDMIKEEHIQQIGRLVPHAKIKKIDRCNHLTIVHKEETIEEIRKYFEGE
jgi:pimeloyl-ACP methyl ester carboxylesterase